MPRLILLVLTALFLGCNRQPPQPARTATPTPRESAISQETWLTVSDDKEAIESVQQAYLKYHSEKGYSLRQKPPDKEIPLEGDGAKKEVARDLVERGLLTIKEASQALSLDEDWLPQNKTFIAVFLLSNVGKCLFFDMETATFPNQHDYLLLDLAGISEGEFQPESVSEQPPPEDSDTEPYVIRFVFNGKAYELEVRNIGDYYDLDRLLIASNRALSSAGRSKRFYVLDTGDQTAIVVYMEKQRLSGLIGEGLLPPPIGADASVQQGKAAEEAVLKMLREQGG